MFNIIAVFFPSIISIKIQNHFLDLKNNVSTIYDYCIYCVLNNIIVVTLFTFIYNLDHDIWNEINYFPGMLVKYLLFASFFAVILGVMFVIIRKNMRFKIEVKKNK